MATVRPIRCWRAGPEASARPDFRSVRRTFPASFRNDSAWGCVLYSGNRLEDPMPRTIFAGFGTAGTALLMASAATAGCAGDIRSEEQTTKLQALKRITYAV